MLATGLTSDCNVAARALSTALWRVGLLGTTTATSTITSTATTTPANTPFQDDPGPALNTTNTSGAGSATATETSSVVVPVAIGVALVLCLAVVGAALRWRRSSHQSDGGILLGDGVGRETDTARRLSNSLAGGNLKMNPAFDDGESNTIPAARKVNSTASGVLSRGPVDSRPTDKKGTAEEDVQHALAYLNAVAAKHAAETTLAESKIRLEEMTADRNGGQAERQLDADFAEFSQLVAKQNFIDLIVGPKSAAQDFEQDFEDESSFGFSMLEDFEDVNKCV